MTKKRQRTQPVTSTPTLIERSRNRSAVERFAADAQSMRWQPSSVFPNRQGPSDLQRAAEIVGWWDATLDADHWFKLRAVEPTQAALLLCGFNPHDGDSPDTVVTNALAQATDHGGPQEFKVVLTQFKDAASTAPDERRTLRQWIDLAKQSGLPVHPWAVEYLAARPMPPVDGPVPSSASGQETPQARQNRRLRRFVELGGELRQAGDTWQVVGKRGALAHLAREERQSGQPRSDPSDVKRELEAAAIREQFGS